MFDLDYDNDLLPAILYKRQKKKERKQKRKLRAIRKQHEHAQRHPEAPGPDSLGAAAAATRNATAGSSTRSSRPPTRECDCGRCSQCIFSTSTYRCIICGEQHKLIDTCPEDSDIDGESEFPSGLLTTIPFHIEQYNGFYGDAGAGVDYDSDHYDHDQD